MSDRTPKESCHVVRVTIKSILAKETRYQDKAERRAMITSVCAKNKISERHIRTVMDRLNNYEE